MSKKDQVTDSERREFLRGSLTAAAGIAVSAATGQTLAAEAGSSDGIKVGKKEGYRLTKHIADYYKSAAI